MPVSRNATKLRGDKGGEEAAEERGEGARQGMRRKDQPAQQLRKAPAPRNLDLPHLRPHTYRHSIDNEEKNTQRYVQ